jgi:hypothetical protein
MSESEGRFKYFIRQINENSERLAMMIAEDIPESLPSIENPDGNDHSFNRHNTDFPGIFSFPSTLPDSLAPEHVIEELESIIAFTRMIIEDLYPKKMGMGDAVVEIDNQFSATKQNLDTFSANLIAFKEEITQMRNSRASNIIDIKALRELEHKLTRIGWEYVKSGYKLPIEFQTNNNSIVHNSHEIERINASLPTQIEQFRDTDIKINTTKPIDFTKFLK